MARRSSPYLALLMAVLAGCTGSGLQPTTKGHTVPTDEPDADADTDSDTDADADADADEDADTDADTDTDA
ncbi:MAG: hypothetical protein KC621_16500, partial [Myxococcales bacterium]|nr:hypothetical protein [Myxococcales bacterium]